MGAGPVTIGLLGGIASGKSSVAGVFRDLGARLLDADALAHEVLRTEAVAREVGRLLGREVLDAEGRPDRRKVGRAVFGDPEKLRALEALVHPLVEERLRAGVAEAAGDPSVAAVVVDAPLLLEALGPDFADCLVYVEAPAEVRRARAAKRGWDAGELARREAAQAPLGTKRGRADHVLVNDGSLEELRAKAGEVFRRILRERREMRG